MMERRICKGSLLARFMLFQGLIQSMFFSLGLSSLVRNHLRESPRQTQKSSCTGLGSFLIKHWSKWWWGYELSGSPCIRPQMSTRQESNCESWAWKAPEVALALIQWFGHLWLQDNAESWGSKLEKLNGCLIAGNQLQLGKQVSTRIPRAWWA